MPARRSWQADFYDCCTPEDLKRFVVDRGLKDPYPQGMTLKYCYLTLLNRADRDSSFRFLGLPAEMRLRVYRCLLIQDPNTHDPIPGTIYPAILRTCKLIHCEARDILSDENHFDVIFSARDNDCGHISREAVVDQDSSGPNDWKYSCLPSSVNDFPTLFEKIGQITVTLSYGKGPQAPSQHGLSAINRYLCNLSSFLMDKHRLKRLRLVMKLEWDTILDESQYRKMLYPLRWLRNISQLTVDGPVPSKLVAQLRMDVRNNEPALNTVRQLHFALEQADDYIDLIIAIHGLIPRDLSEDWMDHGCVEEIQFLYARVEEISCFGITSTRREECILGALHYLRRALTHTKLVYIKSCAMGMVKRSREWKSHETKADVQRFAEAAQSCGERYGWDDMDFGLYSDSEGEWGNDEDAPGKGSDVESMTVDVSNADGHGGTDGDQQKDPTPPIVHPSPTSAQSGENMDDDTLEDGLYSDRLNQQN